MISWTFAMSTITLDWEMPGISGIDTLAKIRESQMTPVIMVTSKNNLVQVDTDPRKEFTGWDVSKE